jgi:ligand-binding sensor domain-containing protein
MRCCWFFLLGMLAADSWAQFPLVREFEMRPGQQRPRILSLAQDDRGIIWAASDLGVLRTDGYSTELVAQVPGILALAAQGSTAVLATSGGAVLRCGGLRCDTLLREQAFVESRISHLEVADDGAVWIGTQSAGLYCLKDAVLTRFTTEHGLPDDHINGLALLPDQRLAVATDQGIALVDGDMVRMRMSEAEGAPDNLVLSIAADDAGRIWAGTDRGGVFHWKPGQDPVRVAQPWPYGAVKQVSETAGMLWACTEAEGLIAIDLELRRGIYRPDTRAAQEPRCLMRASDEALWWCDGSDLIHRADPAILLAAEHEGIDLRDITAICIDREERLWFAKGQRLFRHDARFSEESRLTEVKVAVSAMTPIVSLAATPDGTVWAATFGSGVMAIRRDGEMERFTARDGLSNDNVLHARAAGDAVLFSTLEGVTVKDARGFRRVGQGAGFVFDAVQVGRAIYMAADGKGVRMEGGAGIKRVSASDRTYYALLHAADDRLWAIGPGTGFCLIDETGEQCHAADAPPFNGDVYSLGEAGGRMIAFGSTGALAFDPSTGTATDVAAAFGLEGATAELGTVAADGHGGLWLACSAGLLRIEPRARHFAQLVPAFFNSVTFDGQPAPIDAPVAAPHDRSALVVGFSATHWTDPDALRFQYRLVGYSDRVTETRDRVAAFPELPPGDYRFQVRAFIGSPLQDAPWSELAIAIHPPWWQRWWVIMLFSLIAVAGALLLIRARDRRMLYQQRMEGEKVRFQLEALRSQVDPHFLFNSFNALAELIESEPAQAVEHLEQLSTFFRNILKVRDRERITVQEELRLLKTYFELEQRRFGASVRLLVEVEEDAMRLGIVPLTLQLLVENALKHNVVIGGDPFVISISSENKEIVVRNPIRERATPPRSTGFGLESISKHYAALTSRPIGIATADHHFAVRVPLLDFAP